MNLTKADVARGEGSLLRMLVRRGLPAVAASSTSRESFNGAASAYRIIRDHCGVWMCVAADYAQRRGRDSQSEVVTPRDVGTIPVDAPLTDGCADSARLVYVVTTQNDPWRFDPSALAFTRVGALDCPTTATPESMAIDREGRAFVAMSDGVLFNVDTATAHCVATTFERYQSQRQIYDLSFSTDVTGGTSETLFTSTTCCWSSSGLGPIVFRRRPGYRNRRADRGDRVRLRAIRCRFVRDANVATTAGWTALRSTHQRR